MRLRNKALLITGLICLLILSVTYFNTIRSELFVFIPIVVLCSLLTYQLFCYWVVGRVEKLNKQITEISASKQLNQRLAVSGSDELAIITAQVNGIFDRIQSANDKLDEYVKEEAQREKAAAAVERKVVAADITPTPDPAMQIERNDPLTTLPNRIFFNEILNKSMSHAKRRHKILAVLLIDLDGFKHINDTLGTTVGDSVLKEVGNRIATALRTEDVIARLDGDEFIVLLNDIGQPKFASTVSEKILTACTEAIVCEGNKFFVNASIGICVYPHDGHNLESLLSNADTALYRAKLAGGGCFQFYAKEMDNEAHEFIRLEGGLRDAIKNKELILYFQPKLNIKRGKITGIEALIRWAHPERGIISPAKFIPIAEDTGMINEIGEWAIMEACIANKQWQNEGYEHMTVSVNLSTKQFYHPDTARVIAKALKETGLNPTYLELEINETTVMDDVELAADRLTAIKATGVQISIDHFGTGYTAISQLKRLPVSVLKMDQSFVKGVPNSPNDIAIVNAFIGLAHNLGLTIVAEGVETAEQVQYLAAQNCDLVQGYFLSHPLPAAKIVQQFSKLKEEVLIT